MFYRRRLPHWIPDDKILFVSWRLFGSLPGRKGGPTWLADARIAQFVADSLLFDHPNRYTLLAWVIMPNHVHAILKPVGELAPIMQWLKGRTARKANAILHRQGDPFWQPESFDHWIRTESELRKLITYVENNPVRAGLVVNAKDWRWSSAYGGTDDRFSSSADLDG